MTHSRVKRIVEHLTSTHVGDTASIHIGLTHTTLYLPYAAVFDCENYDVMYVKDADRELWINYDKIEYIEG